MGRKGKHRAGRRKAGGAAGRKPIDPASAHAGALGTQKNARRLFNDALLLHKGGRFRGAIALATLSIEESLKGIELGIAFRKLRDIPGTEQGWLTDHNHKFGHVHGWVVGNMEDPRMADVHAGLAREGKVPLEGGVPVSLERATESARHTRDLVGGLQRVKEMCMYEWWDWKGGAWRGLDLDGGGPEALSMLALFLAEMHHDHLHRSTDFALDTLVAGNPALEELREERAELDAMEYDPGKVRKGEAILLEIYGRVGATGGAAAGARSA